ncbi:MAG TPA: A/G-specific adenine glycosylase [Candidatus Cybelea sp.]|nr:A/G-specific adenine glycosylase [Candidatus Cybelea sp.]
MGEIAIALLTWYDRHRRVLPWRALPGEAADPYRVWLSEIMLQQTTVAAVAPYFANFLALWPSVHHLARASLDDVLRAWQGLGYYARARNLHACARMVSAELDGRFPETEDGLRKLPGVGAYTAAAIAAIAFGQSATVVDGNVERVVARLFVVESPLPAAKSELRALATTLTPKRRAGDFAQAMMDLGATVCLARAPLCDRCPLAKSCAARKRGIAADLPRRDAKRARPSRFGVAFWAVRPDGTVLLRRRPERGLLGGMIEVPSTAWRDTPWTLADAAAEAPLEGDWRDVAGTVEHGFTHFRLTLALCAAEVPARAKADGVWVHPRDFAGQALPTAMKKVCRLALDALEAPTLALPLRRGRS